MLLYTRCFIGKKIQDQSYIKFSGMCDLYFFLSQHIPMGIETTLKFSLIKNIHHFLLLCIYNLWVQSHYWERHTLRIKCFLSLRDIQCHTIFSTLIFFFRCTHWKVDINCTDCGNFLLVLENSSGIKSF